MESDKRWIEALEKTFELYMEKVQIIQKYVCDRCDEDCITIDELSKLDRFTSIKMDIEGAEVEALKGGEKFLRNSAVKVFICSYHTQNQYTEILEILKDLGGYSVTTTDGFMVFINDENSKKTDS